MPEKLDGISFSCRRQDRRGRGKPQSYYTEPMTIRPYQDWSKLYFNARSSKLYPGRVPEFTGKPATSPTPARAH